MYYILETLQNGKTDIIYIGGEFDGLRENYKNINGEVVGFIRQGYTKHPDSL